MRRLIFYKQFNTKNS